jgi:CubicO group peptidase (beta-lactamase class C family)
VATASRGQSLSQTQRHLGGGQIFKFFKRVATVRSFGRFDHLKTNIIIVSDTAALVIVDDGVIVSQWGETSTKFNVHSIRTSLLSALIGIAVANGQIGLNATLDQLGIDDNPPSLTAEEKQARVIDLLKARSGIYHAAFYESPAMRAEKPPRAA